MVDRSWLVGLVIGAAMASGCYLEEGPEPPRPEPPRAQPRAEPSREPPRDPEASTEHRGVAAVVDEIRREDAELADDRSDAERIEDELAARAAELSSLPTEQRTAEAKRLYRDGLLAFERGDAATARDRFIDAYVHAPELHVLAFNIARAAEQAGDCCLARAYYERFLDRTPDDPHHTDVARRLESLVCPSGCPAPR